MADLQEYCARAHFAIVKLRSKNYIKDIGPVKGLARTKRKMRDSRALSKNTTITKANCP